MKIYTGPLKKETKKLIERYQDRLQKLIMPKGLGRVADNNKVYSLEESVAKYSYNLTQDEIKAWVWYRRKNNIPMTNWKSYFTDPSEKELVKWVQNGILFYDDGNLVPLAIFVFGNIYKKIAFVKKNEAEIVKNFGSSVYENHLKVLDDLKPKALSISNPVVAERPVILAISEYALNETISATKDAEFTEPITFQEAFKDWLRTLGENDMKGVRPYEIISFYLNSERKPNNYDKIEWDYIKKQTRDEGERLFKIFLHEILPIQEQLKIDAHFNSTYNAFAPLQTSKIPVALEISKKFKGFELVISAAQAEGVAFIELVGSGIIAYDVGVGKTITAIINIINALNTGKCKRPLIVVPNATYKNWILEIIGNKEFEGILTGTGIIINEWYNLGVDVKFEANKKVAEKSITILTYEGFERLGFNQATAEQHLFELANVLDQGDSSERDTEKKYEKYREMIGMGNKGTIADIEVLGFDFLVVDEAHNFKNIFSEVKSTEGQGKQFQIKGGQPSTRGIKAFFVCNYIQRVYGRNVVLLTATPFTNSPLEIYSMLSLVAYNYMKKMGIYNIRVFFEQFIAETSEYAIKQNGEVETKSVVKSFNNRLALQQLVFSHVSFKTGEDANVPRPCKINLPKTTVLTENGIVRLPKDKQLLTYLEQNDLQKENQKAINDRASEPVSKEEAGKLLSLMSESLNNAFSPFLVGKSLSSYVAFLENQPEDYKDFVENSPKILYTVECIKTVKEWHEKRNEPMSGQVIYSDRGKDYFPLIKEYFNKELGFKTQVPCLDNPRQKVDEVEIISSGMSQDQKEKVKQAFNDGVCKIIIGTSTIKEGINLQEKSTCLYNLLPDWNPTGVKQLEGRIWRQKNKFAYVRIVMPLMENSMDIFIFQKLEEKTARINDLFDRNGTKNVLDEESLDPNEVKFALITDLGVLLRFETKQIAQDLNQKITVLKSNIEDLTNFVFLKEKLNTFSASVFSKIIEAISRLSGLAVFRDNSYKTFYFDDVQKMSSEEIEELTKENQNKIERYKKCFDLLNDCKQSYDDKKAIKSLRLYDSLEYSGFTSTLNQFVETKSKYEKIYKNIFVTRGYAENADIEVIKNDFANELILKQTELEQLKSPEVQQQLMEKIEEQKEKFAVRGGTLDQRVKDFASLNHIMSYTYVKGQSAVCEIPTQEYKATTTTSTTADKERRIRIANANAKARIRILNLQ